MRWHRKGFALYWRSISKPGPGRPPISQELQALIRQLASENDWRARKIQAELEKLGFTVSLATVSRYLPKRKPDPDKSHAWNTFLRNHRDAIAAMDFLVVPTVRFKPLYVWFVIDDGRRWILHANVTAHRKRSSIPSPSFRARRLEGSIDFVRVCGTEGGVSPLRRGPRNGRICLIRSLVVRRLLTGGTEKGLSFSYCLP